MKRTVILSSIFVLLSISFVYAQVSIKAEVDKTSLTSDSTLTYKLTITSLEKNIPAVQLPEFSGFNIVSSAQSSRISLAAGNVKTVMVYTFVLAPTGTGNIKIEPGSIKVKNEAFSTQAFQIEVKQGKDMPKPQIKQGPATPEETQPEPEGTEQSPQITL